MVTLPNDLIVFNATPHPIRFWCAEWPEPIEVPTDSVIDAKPVEVPTGVICQSDDYRIENVSVVRTMFKPMPNADEIIKSAFAAGAHVIVGSIIAAQAYPGQVMAMTPSPGYERVPPDQKRMNPFKFTTFATVKEI